MKALINLTGVYPVGTCVILDSYEVGVVHSANPDASQLHRPIVRVVISAEGVRMEEGILADLADTKQDGTFRRSIIKVSDPAKYAINPSDYFV